MCDVISLVLRFSLILCCSQYTALSPGHFISSPPSLAEHCKHQKAGYKLEKQSRIGICTCHVHIMIHNLFFSLPVAYGLKEFGVSIGPIVRDDVRCNGTESKLTDCPADHIHDCWITETAGVNCCGAPGMNQQAPINSID